MRRKPFGFVALSTLALLSSGCATNQYMGISLKPGAADPVAQALAVKAQSGDKQAQYELGRWFEESTDPSRMKKAIKLYQIAANPRGGTRLLFTPASSGVTTSVVSAGERIDGLPEAKRRLEAIVADGRSNEQSANSLSNRRQFGPAEKKLPDSWDEGYLRKIQRELGRFNSPTELSYDGRFLSLFSVEGPISSERFNSPIYADDTRQSVGVCRLLETTLSQAWPGAMNRCESWQWNVLSNTRKTPKEYFYTINYSHSGIHPECIHSGECSDPPFSTTSFNYPICGWLVFHRFHAPDGSKVLIFASMDEDYYIATNNEFKNSTKQFSIQKSRFCAKSNEIEGMAK